jgi:glycosyltransferase involved in cell wall biosynthesis
MKIALLSFEYPPETGYGGIGTYTWYQARALVKLGHTVHVVAGSNEPARLRVQEHDGVVVYRSRSGCIPARSLRRLAGLGLRWTGNRLENALGMYGALRSLSGEHAYDIVEMPECGAEGLLVNNLLRTRTIVRFHSPSGMIMPYYDASRADIALSSLLERLGMRGAGAYSSCSRFLADAVRDQLSVRRPVRVIPNGIDLDLFDRGEQVEARRKFDIPPGRPMVLFSGRMERRKGIHLCKEIADSILRHYEVAFVFAGQDVSGYMAGTLLPYLGKEKRRGSVHYLGRLDFAAVRACLSQADVFLLPSLWENCPYSCLEAMAAGKAVVGSDQGGMPELIRDGENGLLAEAGNAAAFISCLERLLEDRPLRERLGASARKTVEAGHTDVAVARMSAEYYSECIEARGSPRPSA